MSLREYHRKRDFSRTAEPAGKEKAHAAGAQFVVQKHDATRLHYDFRLEMDGVLKSWAVPKGFPTKRGERRLAVQVDAIDGPKELMIRPPGPLLAGHPVISGTSLSVSGELILVINPSGLARQLRRGPGLTAPAPSRGRRGLA